MTSDDLRDPVILGVLEVSLHELAEVAADLADALETMRRQFKGNGYVVIQANRALQRLYDLGETAD